MSDLAPGETTYSNWPAPTAGGGCGQLGSNVAPSVAVSNVAPTGRGVGRSIVPLVMQEMFGSAVVRIRWTLLNGTLPVFLRFTDIRTISPASPKGSQSPFTSWVLNDRMVNAGSATFLQVIAVVKVITSSGMPLLSPSCMNGESQASPLPSLSVSSWRNVPGMIAGL